MSIESRVSQYGLVFGSWQIMEHLSSDGNSVLFRLESAEDPRKVCALKVVSLIREPGFLEALTEERRESYALLRRQLRKEAEKQLLVTVGTEECLEYTFLDWEDDEGYGRDLLIRTVLPEEAFAEEPAEMPVAEAIADKEPEEEPEEDESGGSNTLLKVLIVLVAVATLCVSFIFGKILLELKQQVDQAPAAPTISAALPEMPTEAPTEEPTEAPTEPPVLLDPTKIVDLSIGRCHAAAVYEDGSVDVVYLKEAIRRKYPAWDVWDASGVAEWTDIIQISVGKFHMAGLRSDGTVVTIGGNASGECDTAEWTDIVSIATGDHVTVGLRADGTVICAGVTDKLGDLSGLADVTAIDMGSGSLEYLKSDGTWNRRMAGGSDQPLGTYPELVKIYSTEKDSLGVLSDGTVVVGRTTQLSRPKLAEWTDIVDIYGTPGCLLGLRSDGTVKVMGYDTQNNQQNVAHWSGIVKLVGPSLALKEDGTMVMSGTSLLQSFDLGPLNKASSVTDGESGKTAYSGSGVNVRSYPGINCDIVTRLPDGTPVIILEKKTTYDGMVWGRTWYGWISMDYVALD